MKHIRVLLIEDNRILSDSITAIINTQADMSVVAADTGNANTLQRARELNPHVVLMDLGLRNQDGLHVVRGLTRELPETKVLGMGLIPTQLDIVEFVEAGASGFVMKDATKSDFLGAIRSVAIGVKIIPPLLTGSLFSHVVDQSLKMGKGQLKRAIRMTNREREIVVLVAEGLSNKDIAIRLKIATYTVKSHVHNILEKLALHSRMQIAKQTRDGLLS